MKDKITIQYELEIRDKGDKEWTIEVYKNYDRVYFRSFTNSASFQKKVDFIKDMVKSYDDGECGLDDLLDAL